MSCGLKGLKGSRETQQPRFKNANPLVDRGSLVDRGCRETLFGPISRLRKAPQQVEIRLPGRRDTPAIIRSQEFGLRARTRHFMKK